MRQDIYPFFQMRGVLSKTQCDATIALGESMNKSEAQVQLMNGKSVDNPAIRKTQVSWLPVDSTIANLLCGFALLANEGAGWNFDLSKTQCVQYTRYDPNGFYDWHVDQALFGQPDTDDYRKISVVAQLSPASEFEGGGIELRGMNFGPNGEEVGIFEQGDIIAFPSFIEHRAKVVTSGVRRVAVCWINGPIYR